jgi:hypothetical protein
MLQKNTLLAAILCAPLFAMALPLDQGLRCEMSAVEFFKPLVQLRLISLQPTSVTGALSHFTPAKGLSFKAGGRLEAFGMPVESIFGYAAGQLMFASADPRITSPDVYGVVVREQIGNVQAQLNSLNATKAKARRITHDTTEIACIGV